VPELITLVEILSKRAGPEAPTVFGDPNSPGIHNADLALSVAARVAARDAARHPTHTAPEGSA
jgi:hypothetical protein